MVQIRLYTKYRHCDETLLIDSRIGGIQWYVNDSNAKQTDTVSKSHDFDLIR